MSDKYLDTGTLYGNSQKDGGPRRPCALLMPIPSKPGAPQSRKGVETLKKFFEDNPGEELSASDAALKIDVKEKSAATYLSALVNQGVVERVSIYRSKSK